jgi:transketolase
MIEDTQEFAREIRKLCLKMVYEAKASHIGGALSMADILAVLFCRILNFDSSNPQMKDRDRLLLSKGHTCTCLYAALALKGFFDLELLNTYTQDGSVFISHASHLVPGVEFSTGSLGHALSVGCGMSLASKRKKENYKTYVIVSDGELDEGSNWESILFAPQHKLNNLILIIDYNKIQSLGAVKEVINLDPLGKKFEAFNWEVYEIDGHDHSAIYNALNSFKQNEKPKVIVANTIKGKGVDFMENKLLWHYKSPSEAEYIDAINKINSK